MARRSQPPLRQHSSALAGAWLGRIQVSVLLITVGLALMPAHAPFQFAEAARYAKPVKQLPRRPGPSLGQPVHNAGAAGPPHFTTSHAMIDAIQKKYDHCCADGRNGIDCSSGNDPTREGERLCSRLLEKLTLHRQEHASNGNGGSPHAGFSQSGGRNHGGSRGRSTARTRTRGFGTDVNRCATEGFREIAMDAYGAQVTFRDYGGDRLCRPRRGRWDDRSNEELVEIFESAFEALLERSSVAGKQILFQDLADKARGGLLGLE